MYRHRQLNQEDWKETCEWYLYDDLLLNAIAGRNLNWNENDDSCVLKFKDDKIRSRLDKSHRKLDIEKIATNSRLAIKIPDLIFNMPIMKTLWPGLKAVVLFRNPEDVIGSIIDKQWFTNEALHPNSPMPQIAYRVADGIRVPMWVADADVSIWKSMNHQERVVYYNVIVNEFLLAHAPEFHVINYDNMVDNPKLVVEQLSNVLNVGSSSKTFELVNSISKRPSKSVSWRQFVNSELISRYDNMCNLALPLFSNT